jgi:hypothetical protein
LLWIEFCDKRLRQRVASGGKDPYLSLPFRRCSCLEGAAATLVFSESGLTGIEYAPECSMNIPPVTPDIGRLGLERYSRRLYPGNLFDLAPDVSPAGP